MHLLEIAATQPSFGNHLGIVRAQTPIHGKASLRPSSYGNENRINTLSSWKLFGISRNSNFNLGHHERPGGTLVIKAVATLEPKRLVDESNNARSGLKSLQLGMDKSSQAVQTRFQNGDYKDLDEKEQLRRTRIAKANKGNTPWNKGKKHSPETIQRIRERTRLAMQDPKVKMKLVNLGHAQSEETRAKIGIGVRLGWQKRRKMLLLQETCHFDWQNLIAEASRKGYDGEVELQWDSYEILKEKLETEWVASVEKRKTTPRPKGSKRAPKSPEQRRKISEAISRKWADSEYRERVVSALAKYHGIEPGVERKPRGKPRDSSESPRRSPVKKSLSNEIGSSKNELKFPALRPKSRSKAPSYKDPLASSKLEMLKNIRTQRAAAENKKIEAIERARLLIAEAEKAAKALEVAATKSPIAQASLLETRKLIAEAVRSIESIEIEPLSSQEYDEDPPVMEDESEGQTDEEVDAASEFPTDANPIKVNGTRSIASSSNKENLGFDKLNLQDILNGNEGLFPSSSTGYGLSPYGYEALLMQSSSMNENGYLERSEDRDEQEKPLLNGAPTQVEAAAIEAPAKLGTVTKRWVRGRLVEVAEGAT